VFHDDTLDRLTGESGPVRARNAKALGRIALKGGGETIPTLAEVLTLVAGKVPLLIEIKDQDGAMGPKVGRLERAVARALEGYRGPVAVMSFNPHSMAAMAKLAPGIPRGLTTSAYLAKDWPELPVEVRARLRGIPDYDRVGAAFISHEGQDLRRRRVAELKARGAHVFAWTIRSAEDERKVRAVAENVTFEGYAVRIPAG
jgi:glycerophosphoryl diester phosphodiesterase